MASDTTLPAQAHIRQIRLFFSGGPQVALYGSPSEVADGWIANLPAAEVFAGDFSGLLYERMIDAQDAHERSPFHTPFYERHVRQAPQPHWPQQAPAAAAGPDAEFSRAALRDLNTARILASRLAQQAQSDNRPEDHQRFLAAAADASLTAAELHGDAEAAPQLRQQALKQFNAASNLATRLAQQARREERPEDQQRWLAAAAEATFRAADMQADAAAATLLREQALRQLTGARNLATRLTQQARRDNQPSDELRHLTYAAKAALKIARLNPGCKSDVSVGTSQFREEHAR